MNLMSTLATKERMDPWGYAGCLLSSFLSCYKERMGPWGEGEVGGHFKSFSLGSPPSLSTMGLFQIREGLLLHGS